MGWRNTLISIFETMENKTSTSDSSKETQYFLYRQSKYRLDTWLSSKNNWITLYVLIFNCGELSSGSLLFDFYLSLFCLLLLFLFWTAGPQICGLIWLSDQRTKDKYLD